MIVRRVDPNGDWTFGKGKGNYCTDELAVEQSLKTRISSWVGDCFFSLNEGVDWRSRLDVGQQALLLEEIKSIILKTEGVISITKVQALYDADRRSVTIKYDVQTLFSRSFQGSILQSVGS